MSSIVVAGDTSGSVTLQAPAVAGSTVLTLPATTATLITDSAGILNIGSGQVYKDASGNVGIGISSPGAKLQVNGSTGFIGTGYYQVSGGGGVYGTNTTFYSGGGDIAMAVGTNSSGYAYQSVTTNHAMLFGTNNTERMRIDSSGNVGIGTSSPGAKLDVNGTFLNAGWNILGNFNAGGTYPLAGNLGFSAGWNFTSGGREIALMNNDYSGGGFNFYQRTAASASSLLMKIDSSGNVGIGTSSPATKLNVIGDLQLSRSATASDATINFGSNGNNYIYGGNSNNIMAFAINASERMRIDSSGNLLVGTTSALAKITTVIGSGQVGYYANKSSTGGGLDHAQYYTDGGLQGKITQTGGFTTVSDYRIKSSVAPLSGMLKKVCKLKPVSYTLTAFGQQQYGFIAHELQEELPVFVDGEKDAVNEDGSIAPQSVDYPKIVSVLTAAIQELKAIIDTQQEQINSLLGK